MISYLVQGKSIRVILGKRSLLVERHCPKVWSKELEMGPRLVFGVISGSPTILGQNLLRQKMDRICQWSLICYCRMDSGMRILSSRFFVPVDAAAILRNPPRGPKLKMYGRGSLRSMVSTLSDRPAGCLTEQELETVMWMWRVSLRIKFGRRSGSLKFLKKFEFSGGELCMSSYRQDTSYAVDMSNRLRTMMSARLMRSQ